MNKAPLVIAMGGSRDEYFSAMCRANGKRWGLRKLGNALSALALAIGFSSGALADEFAAPNQSSTVSSSDRYEIVQSELAMKWTFRLDRFCGGVSQLVSTSDSGVGWQQMHIEGLSAVERLHCELAGEGRPHYQLFTSGLAVKGTFLMNTATGTTWILTTDKSGNHAWELFSH